jgi:hypothetical protein
MNTHAHRHTYTHARTHTRTHTHVFNSEMVGLLPVVVVEFLFLAGIPVSKPLMWLVGIGLPLGHLIDALMLSVKVIK